jgi:hypothetical protein
LLSGHGMLGEDDWHELVEAIKGDFGRFGPKMKETRKTLEKWRLFYNPYHRLDRIVRRNYEELSEIAKSNLELPKDPQAFSVLYSAGENQVKKDIDEFLTQMQSMHAKYERARELSTNLRLICPVWAEAFINLVIFVLTRKDIKDDNRLYQDFLRKEIDIRVKLLHINCEGFERAIDTTDRQYKDFHSLMNERNDLLHGNIDPEKLGYETVYFDGTIPLFTQPQGLARNSLGVSLIGIEPAITLKNVESVRSFIEFVLGHLAKEYREQLSLILDTRDLGWRAETKRIGILFGDFVAEGYAF